MSKKKMWFGNLNYAQWVPAPATGVSRERAHYSSEIEFENGGTWVERSRAGRLQYGFDFPVADPRERRGLDAFERFDQGTYDSYNGSEPDYQKNLLRFTDPMLIGGANVLPPQWANPSLSRGSEWKPIHPGTAVYSGAGTNSTNGLPNTTAQFTVANTTGSQFEYGPCGKAAVLIPPGHTLRVGFWGNATGTAVVRALRWTPAGVSSLVTVPLISTGPLSYGASFSGDTYSHVEFFIERTTAVASTITLRGGWATIYDNAAPAPAPVEWTAGMGHWGCTFGSDPVAQEYVFAGGNSRLVGSSFTLMEVEPWRAA